MRIMTRRVALPVLANLGMLFLAASDAPASIMLSSTNFGFTGDTSPRIGVAFTSDGSDPSRWWDWPTYGLTGPTTSQFWADSTHASGPSFLSFCVDLAHDLTPGRFDALVSTGQAGTLADGTNRDIGAAGWVMTTYINGGDSRPTGLSSGTLDEQYAAIQIAIWKVTYDHTSTSIDGGTYRFLAGDSAVNALAQTILTAYSNATNPDSTPIGLINYAEFDGHKLRQL